MMTPLMTLLLLTAVVTVTAAPHWDKPVIDDGTTSDSSSMEVNPNDASLQQPSKKHIKKSNEAKDTMRSKAEYETVNSQEFPITHKHSKISKKSRKHKNFYFNYPYIPQFNKYTHISSSTAENHDDFIQEKTIGYRKNQQESNIFYVRLPPTPYYFVPGLGYISNPPIFTSSSLRPQQLSNKPYHPNAVYSQHTNSFINLPTDFVSNGKPTSVYQWENNKRKTTKRPTNTPLNKLKKGPYRFNGKPTSLYLLTSDGKATMHQSIRYSDIHGNSIY